MYIQNKNSQLNEYTINEYTISTSKQIGYKTCCQELFIYFCKNSDNYHLNIETERHGEARTDKLRRDYISIATSWHIADNDDTRNIISAPCRDSLQTIAI